VRQKSTIVVQHNRYTHTRAMGSIAAQAFPAIWAISHSFLHGFHIASLNGVQEAVTCDIGGRHYGLSDCLDLSVCIVSGHRDKDQMVERLTPSPRNSGSSSRSTRLVGSLARSGLTR
jgi:hypothetical protein